MLVSHSPADRPRSRVGRLFRHLTAGALSLLVIGALAVYALSPAVATLSAQIARVTSVKAGHESIQGRVKTSGRGGNTTVTLSRVIGRRRRVVGTKVVHGAGRFSFKVSPARYFVAFRHQGHTTSLSLTLHPRQSIFLLVTERQNGGFLGMPVLFNY